MSKFYQIAESLCPAIDWLRERFRVLLELSTGHYVIVDFDLKSVGNKKGEFDRDKVLQYYGAALLDAPNKKAAAQNIADTLNNQMQILKQEVVMHARLAESILVDLHANNNDEAYAGAFELANILREYSPRADQVWVKWLELVLEYTRPKDELDYL